jgi:hypothetical protein
MVWSTLFSSKPSWIRCRCESSSVYLCLSRSIYPSIGLSLSLTSVSLYVRQSACPPLSTSLVYRHSFSNRSLSENRLPKNLINNDHFTYGNGYTVIPLYLSCLGKPLSLHCCSNPPPATRAESQSQASYPQHNKVDKYNTAPSAHQSDNVNYDFKKQQIHNDKCYNNTVLSFFFWPPCVCQRTWKFENFRITDDGHGQHSHHHVNHIIMPT